MEIVMSHYLLVVRFLWIWPPRSLHKDSVLANYTLTAEEKNQKA